MTPVDAREEKRRRRMAIKCFNCGDDHHLDDCPLVRKLLKIESCRHVHELMLDLACSYFNKVFRSG